MSRGLFITCRKQQDANVVSNNQVSENRKPGEMKSHPEKMPRDYARISYFLISFISLLWVIVKTLVVFYLALVPSIWEGIWKSSKAKRSDI